VIARGWGEPHPLQKGLLIFGPRDEPELAVAWQLLRVSHLFACGTWMPDEQALQGQLA
jgi:hypothetical protein